MRLDGVRIERADFGDPRLADFLQAHLDDMAPTAPPESRHALDLSGLQAPGVRVWVGTIADEIAVTGALAAIESAHEEVKSMRVAPGHRGQGLARIMLGRLVEDARERGIARLSLETGSMAYFAPAHRLYRAAGFMECPPFGSYLLDPNSIFLTRAV